MAQAEKELNTSEQAGKALNTTEQGLQTHLHQGKPPVCLPYSRSP